MAKKFSTFFGCLAILAWVAALCGYSKGIVLACILALLALLCVNIRPTKMTKSELRSNGISYDR